MVKKKAVRTKGLSFGSPAFSPPGKTRCFPVPVHEEGGRLYRDRFVDLVYL
jgi:hypothetical protein